MPPGFTPRHQSIFKLAVLSCSCDSMAVCTYLWRKIEAKMALFFHLVLNQKWHFVGQADLDLACQGRGLAEVDQILKREGKGHGLAKLDNDRLILVVDVLMVS